MKENKMVKMHVASNFRIVFEFSSSSSSSYICLGFGHIYDDDDDDDDEENSNTILKFSKLVFEFSSS
jgi:hypothetical protein